MPTYDYECTKCGKKIEIFQSMTDKPKKSCPDCKGKLRRLIGSGSGMIFKGTGFYITDYKKQNSCSTKPSVDNKPKETDKSCASCKDCPVKKEKKD